MPAARRGRHTTAPAGLPCTVSSLRRPPWSWAVLFGAPPRCAHARTDRSSPPVSLPAGPRPSAGTASLLVLRRLLLPAAGAATEDEDGMHFDEHYEEDTGYGETFDPSYDYGYDADYNNDSYRGGARI
ncbi:hypothetical protein ZWY2020_045079 [Hordeum vulgare]|nr:hypothetical protein ZWY2020_045079 [Hordeum vulgare]